jgi:hypothetical protein
MTERNESTLSKHIAGIVPVSKVDSDIDLVLHPGMMPIANDFYAVQRSIVECSYVGCKTIWVVCDESIAPLLKKVCGDFVLNLAQHERAKFANFPQENRTSVPIFYVPISYKNMNKRGIGVSVIEGVTASFTVSDKMSKWLAPYRYYVSMPYGVYDPRNVNVRSLVKQNESFFYTHEGESALTGQHMGFSFSARQFKHCSYLFKRIDVKSDYTLDLVFSDDIMIENSCSIELDKYKDISSWEGYQDMMKDPLKIGTDWRYCFDAALKMKGSR